MKTRLYALVRPLWIDIDEPNLIACFWHRKRLERPALISDNAGRTLRRWARQHHTTVCEVKRGLRGES